eukprot:2716228-Prymnesium_polylepis.1
MVFTAKEFTKGAADFGKDASCQFGQLQFAFTLMLTLLVAGLSVWPRRCAGRRPSRRPPRCMPKDSRSTSNPPR